MTSAKGPKHPVMLTLGVYDTKIWACRALKEFGLDDQGLPKYISNWRDDVTPQAVELVYRHSLICQEADCHCKQYVIHPTREVCQHTGQVLEESKDPTPER